MEKDLQILREAVKELNKLSSGTTKDYLICMVGLEIRRIEEQLKDRE